jgi:hypothetical protein
VAVSVLRPVDVEVESVEVEAERLLIFDAVDVDSELKPLDALAMPVEVEAERLLMPVDKLVLLVLNCATVTASCCAAPSATLVMRRR